MCIWSCMGCNRTGLFHPISLLSITCRTTSTSKLPGLRSCAAFQAVGIGYRMVAEFCQKPGLPRLTGPLCPLARPPVTGVGAPRARLPLHTSPQLCCCGQVEEEQNAQTYHHRDFSQLASQVPGNRSARVELTLTSPCNHHTNRL